MNLFFKYLVYLLFLGKLLRRRPIAQLFDGLKDRLENQIENRAMGAHNRTIVFDFEESKELDGV